MNCRRPSCGHPPLVHDPDTGICHFCGCPGLTFTRPLSATLSDFDLSDERATPTTKAKLALVGGPMIAEVPGFIFVAAHPNRFRARPEPPPGRSIYDLVVIHGTSGHGDAMGTAQMWQQPPAPVGKLGTSAHFVIGQDGRGIQCVAIRFAAEHAHDANGRSIGVEHCMREPGAFGPNDPGLPPSPELYNTSAKLVARLLKAAGLGVHRGLTVEGHNKADPKTTHTGCPDACGFNWPLYLQLLDDEYRKFDDVEPPSVT